MPAANNVFFRPKPGRFGVNTVITSVGVGTLAGKTLATSATNSINLPVPNRKCQLVSLNINALVACDATGAITMQAIKRNNQIDTPADVVVTGTKSLKNDVITVTDAAFNVAITGTDAQATFFPVSSTRKGDTLRIDVVATDITTQPQVVVVAEWAVKN